MQMALYARVSVIVLGFFALVPVYAQTTDADQPTITTTRINGDVPLATAHIIKYFIDNAAPDSDYETGSLHINYDDGEEVIAELPPKKKSSKTDIVYNQEGFSETELAEDKRTIGWTETVDNCCTPYSVPLMIAVYRSGKIILHIKQGQMVWYWSFLDGGKHVVAVWGPIHGPEVGDYQLYDAITGRMISEVMGNAETQSLASDAPEWARQTEQAMHRQK